MTNDYYETLGVSATASQANILKAYRQMAMKYHPDRGGSHERMVDITAAFDCLRNPESRRQYDYARNNINDPSVQAEFVRSDAGARERAQNYPRDWHSFENLLNQLSKDFSGAEYGAKEFMPTVKNSLSGYLFIIGGMYLGHALFKNILEVDNDIFKVDHDSTFTVYLKGVSGLLILCLSAWCGRIIHQFVAKTWFAPTGEGALSCEPQSNMILPCPDCGKRLRVPNTKNRIKIKCPSCQNQFTL